MADEAVERNYPATLPHVNGVVELVSALAAAAGISPERQMRLELAVEEAVTNLCRHAYAGRGGELTVRINTTESALAVELEDAGPPFDPLAAPPPDLTLGLEQRRPGGLGIFLIRRSVDDVAYRRERERNILTMVMKREQ
jgi:serine/threonine-protein kinase RsbW